VYHTIITTVIFRVYLVFSESLSGRVDVVCSISLFILLCWDSVPNAIIVEVDGNGDCVLAGSGDCSEAADANTSNSDALITKKKHKYILNKSRSMYSLFTVLDRHSAPVTLGR